MGDWGFGTRLGAGDFALATATDQFVFPRNIELNNWTTTRI